MISTNDIIPQGQHFHHHNTIASESFLYLFCSFLLYSELAEKPAGMLHLFLQSEDLGIAGFN